MSVLDHPRVVEFDAAVDRAFDHLRGRRWADRVMYSLTEVADHSVIWHIASVTDGLVGGEQGMQRMIRLSGALGVESALVNGLIKNLFRRERPVHEGVRPHRLRTPRTTSFPSGHASSAAVAVVLLSDGRSPAARAAFAALGVVVATSRIHVRIHHASDVVGGAVLGTALGVLARRAFPLR